MSPAAKKGSAEFARVERAAKFVLSRTKLRPRVGVVLGSGLGAFGDELKSAVRIPYEKIPGFPRSTVVGHAGRLVVGKAGQVPVAAMQGRVHYYEGCTPEQVIFPMRVMWRIGVRAMILTNATGGINRNYSRGALVVIRDHINLMGMNPLVGPNDERFGPRFFDMTTAYSKPYREIVLREARRLGINIHEGVYCAVSGPSYETPAEIQLMERTGADLVGMSTVPEVIAARHMGIKVLGISCVTNMAAGVTGELLNHEEMLEIGWRVQGQLVDLLRAVIPHLAADVKKED